MKERSLRKKSKRGAERRIETPFSLTYPTSDNWRPNFPRNTVEIRVHVYYNCIPEGTVPNGMIRVCVSGADDTGMERDERLDISEYESRLKEIGDWLAYKLPNPLTMAWLRTQGFKMW